MALLHHVLWLTCLCCSGFASPHYPCGNGFFVKAECLMTPDPSDVIYSNITGSVKMNQFFDPWCNASNLNIHVQLKGVPLNDENPTNLHGMHVHDIGNISTGCNNVGSIFNPLNRYHGALYDTLWSKKVGDFGNVRVRAGGVVNQAMLEPNRIAMLSGPNNPKKSQYDIMGKSIVLKWREDDLGKGGNEQSLIDGNSGKGIACCQIVEVPPPDETK